MKLNWTKEEKDYLFTEQGAGKKFEYLHVVGLKKLIDEYKELNNKISECKQTLPALNDRVFGNHELHILFLIGAKKEKQKILKQIKKSIRIQKKYGY